jgi:hypothetical protein
MRGRIRNRPKAIEIPVSTMAIAISSACSSKLAS